MKKVLNLIKNNVLGLVVILVLITSITAFAGNVISNNKSEEPTTTVANDVAIENVIIEPTTEAITIAQTIAPTVAPTTIVPTIVETQAVTQAPTQAVVKALVAEVVTQEPTTVAKPANTANAKYFTYNMVGGGDNIYITGYQGSESNLVIPSYIDGYRVTGIADDLNGVFSLNITLTSITFPEGLTYIGACVCRSSTNLSSVTLPSTLTTIKHGAFMNCKSLKSINIPNSLNSIEDDSSIFSCGKENGEYLRPTLIIANNSYVTQYSINNKIPYIVKQ